MFIREYLRRITKAQSRRVSKLADRMGTRFHTRRNINPTLAPNNRVPKPEEPVSNEAQKIGRFQDNYEREKAEISNSNGNKGKVVHFEDNFYVENNKIMVKHLRMVPI
jgi:hypothetical protein